MSFAMLAKLAVGEGKGLRREETLLIQLAAKAQRFAPASSVGAKNTFPFSTAIYALTGSHYTKAFMI